jgi:hypothetical protein
MKKCAWIGIVLLLLAACNTLSREGVPPSPMSTVSSEDKAAATPAAQAESGGAPGAPTSRAADEVDRAAATGGETEKIPPKIIKTADINFRVDDYRKSRAAIGAILAANPAYIASEQESNNGYTLANTLVIRVEAGAFDRVVAELVKGAAYLQQKNITARDVTEEYVDITARLRTKKAVAAQYEELLKRAGSISDVLAVERELRTVREEIESTEGRLRYLSNQVAYSTINLYFYQNLDRAPDLEKGFWAQVGEALQGGWTAVRYLAIGAAYAWPLWLVIAVLVWLIRRAIRRHRAQKQPAASARSQS